MLASHRASIAQRDPGLRDPDPTGAQIRMYPAPIPSGDWAYIVDDFGVRYRRTGWWPFRRGDVAEERREIAAARRSAARRGVPFTLTEESGWCSVRLAPDTEYCAAGQNYVLLGPDNAVPWKASADLQLWVRPQGVCAVVVTCQVDIDLREMTTTLCRVHDDWPEGLKAQAAAKATKVAAFLTDHVARRAAGRRKVPTAYEKWIANR